MVRRMVNVKERMTSELKHRRCVFGACCNFLLVWLSCKLDDCVLGGRAHFRHIALLALVPLLLNMVLCSLMLVRRQILLTLGWFNCVRIPKHFKCLMLCRITPSRWIKKTLRLFQGSLREDFVLIGCSILHKACLSVGIPAAGCGCVDVVDPSA